MLSYRLYSKTSLDFVCSVPIVHFIRLLR